SVMRPPPDRRDFSRPSPAWRLLLGYLSVILPCLPSTRQGLPRAPLAALLVVLSGLAVRPHPAGRRAGVRALCLSALGPGGGLRRRRFRRSDRHLGEPRGGHPRSGPVPARRTRRLVARAMPPHQRPRQARPPSVLRRTARRRRPRPAAGRSRRPH